MQREYYDLDGSDCPEAIRMGCTILEEILDYLEAAEVVEKNRVCTGWNIWERSFHEGSDFSIRVNAFQMSVASSYCVAVELNLYGNGLQQVFTAVSVPTHWDNVEIYLQARLGDGRETQLFKVDDIHIADPEFFQKVVTTFTGLKSNAQKVLDSFEPKRRKIESRKDKLDIRGMKIMLGPDHDLSHHER